MKEIIINFIKSIIGKFINKVGVDTFANDLIKRICKKDYGIKNKLIIDDIIKYIRKQQIQIIHMSPNDFSYLINEYYIKFIKEETK